MTEHKKWDKGMWAACIFFLLFSVLFIGVGCVMLSVERNQQAECSETAQANIVEIKDRHSGKHWRHAPVVTYMANGEMVKVTAKTWKTSTNLKVGDAVTVHYSPRTEELWIEGYDGHFSLMLAIPFLYTGAMIGLLVLVAGILGIRGRVLKGTIIFFALGLGLIWIVTMVNAFRGSNQQEMLLQSVVAGVIAFAFFKFKVRKDRQFKKDNDHDLISDHEADRQ